MNVFAQEVGAPTAQDFTSYGNITAPYFSTASITDILNGPGPFGLVTIIFFMAGSLLLIFLILGGIELMTSRGNPDSISNGKKRITNALIGMIIVFTSYWITRLVGVILNIQPLIDLF